MARFGLFASSDTHGACCSGAMRVQCILFESERGSAPSHPTFGISNLFLSEDTRALPLSAGGKKGQDSRPDLGHTGAKWFVSKGRGLTSEFFRLEEGAIPRPTTPAAKVLYPSRRRSKGLARESRGRSRHTADHGQLLYAEQRGACACMARGERRLG